MLTNRDSFNTFPCLELFGRGWKGSRGKVVIAIGVYEWWRNDAKRVVFTVHILEEASVFFFS